MEPNEVYAVVGIGFSVIVYHRPTGNHTPETKTWDSWMSVMEPIVFSGDPEPEAEGYADFTKAVSYYSKRSREDRLAFGKSLLDQIRVLPGGGNYVHRPDPTT